MGDLMHALPALTDARAVFPDISFDWVVDEAFAEVPSWHPAVKTVYRSAHRRWRKSFFGSLSGGEFSSFYKGLNEKDYDVVIDAQNNVKSAFISFLRKGPVHGMDKNSVAEQPAYLAYKYRHFCDRKQHAIARQRELFAKALGYEVPDDEVNYGVRNDAFLPPKASLEPPYIFLVHNASWTTKLWPEACWHEFIELLGKEGYYAVLPGGSEEELERANRIAADHNNAFALPKMGLTELGGIIKQAKGALCCDTGLAHLTALVGTPAITFYGPTSKTLIGTTGQHQQQLIADPKTYPCASCYQRKCTYGEKVSPLSSCMQSFTPKEAWENLKRLIAG